MKNASLSAAKPTVNQLRSLLSDIPSLCCVVKDEDALQVNSDKFDLSLPSERSEWRRLSIYLILCGAECREESRKY